MFYRQRKLCCAQFRNIDPAFTDDLQSNGGASLAHRPSYMPRSALDSLSHSQFFLVSRNKTLVMDAGGLNDVAAVPLWVNLQNSGGWNFLSFCQGVRRLVGLASQCPLIRLPQLLQDVPLLHGPRAPNIQRCRFTCVWRSCRQP